MKKLLIIAITILLILATPLTVFGADNSNKCAVYLHFNNVMTNEGFKDFDYTTQYLSYGTGWNFTKKKLDNFITCKTHFEYEGDEYTFTGNWLYEDGSQVTFPVSVKPKQGQTEIHITVTPEYDVQIVKHLTVERIDPIRNTNASASNKNKVISYTHTFENPNDLGILDNYKFLGWKYDEDLVQPGESRTWVLDDFTDKENTITYVAQYQPAIEAFWYVDDEVYQHEISFDKINSNINCDVNNFDCWLTEDEKTPDEIYYPNNINEEVKVVKFYASKIKKDDEIISEDESKDISSGSNNPDKDDPKTSDKTSNKTSDNNSLTNKTVVHKYNQIPVGDINEVVKYITTTSRNEYIIKQQSEIPETTIDENNVPLSNTKKSTKDWALINLILMICTALALLKLSDKKYNIIAIILPVVSMLLFVFTENTENPMILIDKWTLWMLIIYIAEIVFRVLGKKEENEEDEV